jgi:hypothetical protein
MDQNIIQISRPLHEEFQRDLNTPKRAIIGSIQLPHLTDIQLYWVRKTNTNKSKVGLGTRKNHHEYM